MAVKKSIPQPVPLAFFFLFLEKIDRLPCVPSTPYSFYSAVRLSSHHGKGYPRHVVRETFASRRKSSSKTLQSSSSYIQFQRNIWTIVAQGNTNGGIVAQFQFLDIVVMQFLFLDMHLRGRLSPSYKFFVTRKAQIVSTGTLRRSRKGE